MSGDVRVKSKNVDDLDSHIQSIIDSGCPVNIIRFECVGFTTNTSREQLLALKAMYDHIQQNFPINVSQQFLYFENKNNPTSTDLFKTKNKDIIELLGRDWIEGDAWRAEILFAKKRALAEEALNELLSNDNGFKKEFDKHLDADASKYFKKEINKKDGKEICTYDECKQHMLDEAVDHIALMAPLKAGNSIPKVHNIITMNHDRELSPLLNFVRSSDVALKLGYDCESLTVKKIVYEPKSPQQAPVKRKTPPKSTMATLMNALNSESQNVDNEDPANRALNEIVWTVSTAMISAGLEQGRSMDEIANALSTYTYRIYQMSDAATPSATPSTMAATKVIRFDFGATPPPPPASTSTVKVGGVPLQRK